MSKVKVSTPSDREVRITREVNAPRALVFDCLSKPELVRQWLLGPPGWSMPVCEMDFRVGGRLRYVWRNADGRDMTLTGEYKEIVRPSRIVHTELFEPDWTAGEAIDTTEFTEKSGITTMSITVLYSNKETRDAAVASGMADGMEAGYARLDELLASLQVAAK